MILSVKLFSLQHRSTSDTGQLKREAMAGRFPFNIKNARTQREGSKGYTGTDEEAPLEETSAVLLVTVLVFLTMRAGDGFGDAAEFARVTLLRGESFGQRVGHSIHSHATTYVT